MSMKPLLEQARQCEFFQGALRDLAQVLPPDDAELNAAIAEVVATRDERAFRSLFFAALGAGRKVDAQHLAEGSALFSGPPELLCSARSCRGDVASALLAAVLGGRMGIERETTALLLARMWCEDRNAAVPAGFWATARQFTRRSTGNFLAQVNLAVLAHLGKDEGLASLLAAKHMSSTGDGVERSLQAFREIYLSSPWTVVPERRPPTVLSGYTVRRAVPRVGRNDPCPCASGKKYKKCCFDKDQERLLQSSAVEGMTLGEWRAQPELALSIDRLRQMRSYEVVKLDPAKVPANLHEHLLDRLLLFKEHEAVVRFFESAGFHPDLEFYWGWALEAAGTDRQLGAINRLLALRPELDLTELPLHVRLLRAGDPGAALLDLVENEARKDLRADDSPSQLALMAHSLMDSRAPALGVLVARSLLPLLGHWEGEIMLDAILDARDKLELSSDEPFETIFEERFRESQEQPHESEEQAVVRRAMEAKSDEVNRLRAELKSIYREMEKRRQRDTATPAEPKLAAPDDRAMTELRGKVESLQSLLKERHSERNQLRRELEMARAQLATSVARPATEEPKPDAVDREDELLLAGSDLGQQPVRVPEFPKKFTQITAGLPRSVVRAALVLTARLAGGEPAAFVGVRPLRAWPEVYRQRVGGGYRLLFRLPADRLEVVDLINRRDLERTIKTRGSA